jgi:hypothetical protein
VQQLSLAHAAEDGSQHVVGFAATYVVQQLSKRKKVGNLTGTVMLICWLGQRFRHAVTCLNDAALTKISLIYCWACRLPIGNLQVAHGALL